MSDDPNSECGSNAASYYGPQYDRNRSQKCGQCCCSANLVMSVDGKQVLARKDQSNDKRHLGRVSYQQNFCLRS